MALTLCILEVSQILSAVPDSLSRPASSNQMVKSGSRSSAALSAIVAAKYSQASCEADNDCSCVSVVGKVSYFQWRHC